MEYGLIDRVENYQADDKEVQERLMERSKQLSAMIAQQKSFLEQLEHLRQQGKNPEQKEKKLGNGKSKDCYKNESGDQR